MLHTVLMALMFSLPALGFGDDADLEFQFSPTWCVLLHLEDTADHLSPLETVVILQTDTGLPPVCRAVRTCRETHLEKYFLLSSRVSLTCSYGI